MDLFGDLCQLYAGYLASRGFAIPPGTRPWNIACDYYTVRRQHPAARCRRVHRAPEFVYAEKHRDGMAALERDLVQGIDLAPRLPRRIGRKQIDRDALLDDWGIHHLHLGTVIQPDGLVNGDDDVAFVILEPNDAYLIQVLPHGSWSDTTLLEIVHRNWPHLMTPLPLAGGDSGTTRKSVASARRANTQAIVQLSDGTVLGPRGGGYASDASSLASSLAAAWDARTAAEWEKAVHTTIPRVLETFAEHGECLPDEFRFTLQELEGRWVAAEVTYGFSIELPRVVRG